MAVHGISLFLGKEHLALAAEQPRSWTACAPEAQLQTESLFTTEMCSVPWFQVLAAMATESQSEAGLETRSSDDQLEDRAQTQSSQWTTEDLVKSSSNGQAARLSDEKADANGWEVYLPSIQSPASTLADTLSALSLATPAVKVSKASRLRSVSDQCQAEEPTNAHEGDAAVGLVYDKIMEDHTGPPSKPSPHVTSPWRLA